MENNSKQLCYKNTNLQTLLQKNYLHTHTHMHTSQFVAITPWGPILRECDCWNRENEVEKCHLTFLLESIKHHFKTPTSLIVALRKWKKSNHVKLTFCERKITN